MTIIEAFEKHKNLKLAAEELGIKWQLLYVQLRKAGIRVIENKGKHLSVKDKITDQAELEFKRLIPFAEYQNGNKLKSQFNFLVNGEKVDIKASKQSQGCKKYSATKWTFFVKKQEFCADFIVCFAFLDEGYRLLLIPGECIRNYHAISVSTKINSKCKWLQYEIQQNELVEFFSELKDMK
jgi:hypothetical protein